MQAIRPLLCAAAVLTLLISACSQPEDLTAPTLEPQFGTDGDDTGFDVSVVPNGRVFVLSEEERSHHDEDDPYFDWEEENLYLTAYDGNGNSLLSASSVVISIICEYAYGNCDGDWLKPLGLYADAKGFRYALYVTQASDSGTDIDPDRPYVDYFVAKLDASGNHFTYTVGQGNADPAGSVVSAAVDSNGNIHIAKVQYTYDHNTKTGTYTNVVAKYSTNGTLQWQRASPVGTPSDITVSSSGSVYVVGTKGMARYSNSGGLSWTKTGNFEEVVISGSHLYTRYRKDVRKYDGTGKQLWLKTQSGLSTMVFQDMTGDGSGNVYLSGKYDADSSSKLNMNAMVRKLNSSGSVLWTKTYGTSAYDDAKGIATITGSEIYATGLTKGSLAHTNRGGEDGYLRKFSSSGGTVWTR